jgi:8-oxo-dGTP pyrophosphatase MutT (NUDIX family)
MKAGIDFTGVAVSVYCHDKDGYFLFHKRSENCRDERGTWNNGGGKLEFGESPEETLKRELSEEYGCSGSIEEALPPQSFLQVLPDGTKKHWIILPYIVLVDRLEAKMNEPESMTEIGWYKLNELPSPLHAGTKEDLAALERHFRKFRKDQ